MPYLPKMQGAKVEEWGKLLSLPLKISDMDLVRP
jgi:hypothetical protein